MSRLAAFRFAGPDSTRCPRRLADATDPPSGGKPLMATGSDLIARIAGRQNLADYQKKHWTGSFADYLDIIRDDPKVTRSAYQRVYDMILSHGTEEVIVNKEKTLRYKFFDDRDNQGQDAIFGLEKTLLNLVNILKSAAHKYGTERRVLLLHGPVG